MSHNVCVYVNMYDIRKERKRNRTLRDLENRFLDLKKVCGSNNLEIYLKFCLSPFILFKPF